MADPFEDLVGSIGNPSSTENKDLLQAQNLEQLRLNQQEEERKRVQAMLDSNLPRRGGETTVKTAALLKAPSATLQEGAKRVNENTNSYGVVAAFKPDGSLELFNDGVTAKSPVYPVAASGLGEAPGQLAVANNTPLSVNSILTKLNKATDVDTATGYIAALRNSVAIESTKMETQAQQFAENQMGVPQLQKQLNEAMAADQADPLYRPGMGDSPITAKIRTALDTARGQANSRAKVLLNNNPQYAVLGSSMKTAEEQYKRIQIQGDRMDAFKQEANFRKDLRQQEKKDAMTDAYEGLDPTVQQRMLILNPQLETAQPDDRSLQGARILAGQKNNKPYQEALMAPEEALPRLALSGNGYAKDLVVSKEIANTGASKSEVEARLSNLQNLMNQPKFLNDALTKLYNGDKKKVADEIAAFNAKGVDAEGKKVQAQYKYDLAMKLMKGQTTALFANDLGNWKVSDPMFQDAVTQTRQITGRTNMRDVLNKYLGDSDGQDRVNRASVFADFMTQEAQKQTQSMFGAPNWRALRTQIFAEAGQTLASKYMQQASNAVQNWMGGKSLTDYAKQGIKLASPVQGALMQGQEALFGGEPLKDPMLANGGVYPE